MINWRSVAVLLAVLLIITTLVASRTTVQPPIGKYELIRFTADETFAVVSIVGTEPAFTDCRIESTDQPNIALPAHICQRIHKAVTK